MFELSEELAVSIDQAQLTDVLLWLDDLDSIHTAKPKAAMVAQVASRRGVTASCVNQKYYGVKKHGAKFLVDGRSNHKAKLNLYGHRSPAFIQWVHDFYYTAKRNNVTPTVHDTMIAALELWRADPTNPDLKIPGYETPPLNTAESGYEYPYGWSIRQLNDIKPDAYKSALGGVGRQAANLLLPPVFTTRVGMKVGQCYMFDDQWYDIKAQWSKKEVVRYLGINCLDLFSGCDVQRSLRPYLKDEEAGNKALAVADTIWLGVDVLTFQGYHPDGCDMVAEAGTSTFTDTFKAMANRLSNGKITFSEGEVSKEIVKGVLAPSKGNPRFKAARESWFNLLRNAMSMAPGQIGWNRDNVPEDTERVVSEEKKILALAAALDASVQAKLRYEIMTPNEAVALIHNVSESINQRTRHKLEGWEELGFDRIEFRHADEWISREEYMDLPGDVRGLIMQRIEKGEILSRTARLSPRAVHDMGRSDLKRITPFLWHQLIPQEYAIAAKVPANRTVRIERKKYGPKPIIFQGIFWTENCEDKPLPAGKDVLIYLSPLRLDFAIFCDTAGRLMGIVFQAEKCNRNDSQSLIRQFAQRNRLKSQIGGTAEVYNQALADERNKRREHNRETLIEAGVDPKKIGTKKKQTNARKNELARRQKEIETADEPRIDSIEFPALPEPDSEPPQDDEPFTGFGIFGD